MVELLEWRAVRERVASVSVAQYERMGERIDDKRTELIWGIIIEKMTISPLHSFLVARLYRLFQPALGRTLHCRQEQPLKLADSMPEPDLAVVTGQEADYRSEHPTSALLALEVAVTSSELDRAKALLYAEAGVPEYWLVLANQERIIVHTAPVGRHYTQTRGYGRGEMVVSMILPALRVEIDALFAE